MSKGGDFISTEDFSKLTVATLKERLKFAGLPITGKKAELVARLEEQVGRAEEGREAVRHRPTADDPARHTTDSVPNGRGDMIPEEMRTREAKERAGIVLWRHPVTTLLYFVRECLVLAGEGTQRLLKAKVEVLLLGLAALLLYTLYRLPGPHQAYVTSTEAYMIWALYWVGLGVLSSVGLGTGLHTFLLYLGPHIASVTLAAFECGTVDFPEPPYPAEILCPEDDGSAGVVSLWTIMSKVRLEAMMWGAGTALGELPPYFMARAARMSGVDESDLDDIAEFEDLLQEAAEHPSSLTVMERAKLGVHRLVQQVGFWGILVCASIPNPLFDLAGITCGHFLVPFWTFFGATLIGKAVIKMHIQKLFVIFTFSEHHVESVVSLLKYIPVYGKTLQTPFKDWLASQKAKLHHKPGTNVAQEGNWLGWVFEKLVLVMVVYFLVSIVNSLAQSYHKRRCALAHHASTAQRKDDKIH